MPKLSTTLARSRRALVTGAGGFAGSHLVELLVSQGHQVTACLSHGEKLENLKEVSGEIELIRFNLTDPRETLHQIKKAKPQWIFHLAAFASVGQSFEKERLTYDVNFDGTLNLLDAAQNISALQKFVFVSSAEVYGKFTPKSKLLSEDQALNPISPYGISKAAAEYLISYQSHQFGLPAVILRPFNHIGPRQSEVFALPGFCKQIVEIEQKKKPPVIEVGDLSVKRDLSDVRNIVNGYVAAAEKGKPGAVYQLCSGKAMKLESVLKSLIRMSEKKIRVKVDGSRLRPADIPVLRGNFAKAHHELGWKPRYSLQSALRNTLEYWRDRLR